ncbi:hypothetical protein EPD60_06775 [Flaviaesturariibacter flavus]|uniref:Long-chain fatty acid transporter n=1 Tax=Flaviaesturariibacter flavus TaxID=2502780 RepID=A0A4R1BII0_9BACT|nr:hypothetical protein [Flaviaesturariibacter flavus]TCJ13095.1 hypothetical protein EPD60_13575 [Flaviaesturariibacter flavus]TCJ17007.1 hypothetical protein EPD60_06775 [Flaviaesturariibacter flavus]
MRSAASTLTSEKTKHTALRLLGASALALTSVAAGAQGNSPYSRYGLGDQMSNTHVINRGMGGISAGDADNVDPTGQFNRNFYSHINFSNPASYSTFLAPPQRTSGQKKAKAGFGRVLFDVGVAIDNRTLRAPGVTDKFTSSEINISYIQVGIPIKKGWGMVFGLRPLSRIGYQIQDSRRLPGIDSVFTEYQGSGGSYLASVGTGVAIGNLSLGVNFGYLFGNRDISTIRDFENDTVLYYHGVYREQTSYGKLFFNAGAQYLVSLNKAKDQYIRFGASGNIRHKMTASQDRTVGTFTIDPTNLTDSVFKTKDNKGEIIYPSSYTVGFVAGGGIKGGGFWQGGVDVVHSNWDEYRFYGQTDAVQSNTIIRVGGQLLPAPLSRSLFGRTAYRAGFAIGKDYVTASGRLPFWSATAGIGLPLGHRNNMARNQQTMLNFALEYLNRGNNNNLLKENNFRVSIGLNLSDAWFLKRKYD